MLNKLTFSFAATSKLTLACQLNKVQNEKLHRNPFLVPLPTLIKRFDISTFNVYIERTKVKKWP